MQRSGTTFVEPTPPSMLPTFVVVPASSRPSGIAATARAAARIALRPASGRMPACAARPWNSARSRYMVGEATMTSPIGVAWSNT